MSDVDYRTIEPPADKSPEEYSWGERRAVLLRAICASGGPKRITNRRYAEKFGVSESQISQDIDKLEEFVAEHVDDGVLFEIYALRQRVISDLLRADDWKASAKALELALTHAEWVGVDPTDLSGDGDGDRGMTALEENDGNLTRELSEQDKQHFRDLKKAAERRTTNTRIDENGDDLSPEDLGLDPVSDTDGET